jgi:hypothetical protein
MKISNRLHRGSLLFIGLLVAGLLSATVLPAPTAMAASCRHYDTVADNYLGMDEFAVTWYYADKTSVPSSSGCVDINLTRESIAHPLGGSICANFRVRFFPSSGGSYTNGSKYVCSGYGSLVLASAVKNGTNYRIEVDRQVKFHIFD